MIVSGFGITSRMIYSLSLHLHLRRNRGLLWSLLNSLSLMQLVVHRGDPATVFSRFSSSWGPPLPSLFPVLSSYFLNVPRYRARNIVFLRLRRSSSIVSVPSTPRTRLFGVPFSTLATGHRWTFYHGHVQSALFFSSPPPPSLFS